MRLDLDSPGWIAAAAQGDLRSLVIALRGFKSRSGQIIAIRE
jgi:hypothetical protein